MVEARYKNMWKYLKEKNYEYADISGDMRCTICRRILINAHNSDCGCRYCLGCVKEYLNGEKKLCPGNMDDCQEEELDIDSNIYPDRAMNYRISKLVVECRYSCGCRCELSKIEEHEKACQKQPVECPYVRVGCKQTRLVNEKINEHFDGEKESHSILLMACIDRLENEIKSMKTDSLELRSEIVEMRLARELDEVRVRDTSEMIDQIKQEVANLKNENKLTKEENDSLKAEIERYQTQFLRFVSATDNQWAELLTWKQMQTQEREELRNKCICNEQKIEGLKQQTEKEKEELRKHFDEANEKQANKLDVVKERIQEISVNTVMGNWEEFVWPIDDWTAKRQSARDGSCQKIFSDPFYSHKNGYKMCLSVYPEGSGDVIYTHLSLYFHIMQGPFDNILSWPCKRTITYSLVNQQTGNDHIKYSATFDDFPNIEAWKKPTTTISKGFGQPEMIELTNLSSNPDLVQNDQIFIRCVVK